MNRFLFLVLIFSLSGCSKYFGPVDGQNDVSENVIHINPDGNFYEIPEKINGIEQEINSSAKYNQAKEDNAFKAIIEGASKFNKVDSNGFKHIMLYFHGGLNTRKHSLQRVVADTPLIKEDGIYPIFINWRSGPVSTLKDHYFRIRNGEIDDGAIWTSPIYILGDLTRTIGNIPIAWWTEGAHAIQSTLFRDDTYLFQEDVKKTNVTLVGGNQSSSTILRSLQWLITSPVKLFTTPLMFTVGTPAWDNMKRRTQTMFIRPQDLEDSTFIISSVIDQEIAGAEGGVLNFLDQLQEYVKKEGQAGTKIKLTVIGHSMGGIIVNRILEYFPRLPVNNLVYMASADNLQNFLDASVHFVNTHKAGGNKDKETNVYSLHLHPENEDREINGWGLIPSGSLLVWIDNSFDSPEYTLQRMSGRWENITKISEKIPPRARNYYNFKIFGQGSQIKYGPQMHVEFGECKFAYWTEKYWGKKGGFTSKINNLEEKCKENR